MTRKLVLYTCGLPGSGKTTLSLEMSDRFGGTYIGADRIGRELYLHPKFNQEEWSKVRAEMGYRIEDGLYDKSVVVVDCGAGLRADREFFCALAAKNGADALCIWLRVPIELARQRSLAPRIQPGQAGAQLLTNAQFEAKLRQFENPADMPHVIEIPGDINFEEQLALMRCKSELLARLTRS